MRLRRILSTVLALTFFFIILPHVGAFADTAGHRAEAAIERWSSYGFIMGYDGSFRPDDPITRAEMAVIIDRMVSYRFSTENTYRDLDEGWYTDAVLKVSAAGVMQGYEGLVRPFDNITRAEATVMLARTFSLTEYSDGVQPFSDAETIPAWAVGFIGALASQDALPFEDVFAHDKEITRAEVVLILDALLPEVYKAPGLYSGNVHGNVLVASAGVVLTDMTVSGNVYLTAQATDAILDGTTILGKIYQISGDDATANNDNFTGDTEMPSTSVKPAEDIANELDLSYTGDETVSVIVHAGRSLAQIFELLEEKGVCSASRLFAACETIDFSRYYPLLESSYRAEHRVFALEGYIAPGTYTLYSNSSPELVLKTLLDASLDGYADYAARAAALGYTLDEIVTIASILEKEVGGCTAQDHATAASVIYNRLSDEIKLQMNVTENYLETYVLPYISVDADTYSAYYDTYVCNGLPAGAICSPREDCIEAALAPYDTDYLFFRSDRYGNIYYASTYEEHVQNGSLAKNATGYVGYLGNVTVPDEDDVTIPVDGRYSGFTVMLDPGHGGVETGAYTGDTAEKEINLSIAYMLRDLLRAEGVNVLMTRDSDIYLTADERVALAQAQVPDLFLSIHCNAYEDDTYVNGIETYYYPDDEPSSLWASYVQDTLIAASAASDRGVKEREQIVLHYTEMPSIMVELGFLTSTLEGTLLQSDTYQTLLAQALADGTFAYLDTLTR